MDHAFIIVRIKIVKIKIILTYMVVRVQERTLQPAPFAFGYLMLYILIFRRYSFEFSPSETVPCKRSLEMLLLWRSDHATVALFFKATQSCTTFQMLVHSHYSRLNFVPAFLLQFSQLLDRTWYGKFGFTLIICLYVCMYECMCVCQLLASFTYFGQLLRFAHKRIVNMIKCRAYIEMKLQVDLIRFRHKYRLYSRLRLRSGELRDPLYVYSIFARWPQLVTTKLIGGLTITYNQTI